MSHTYFALSSVDFATSLNKRKSCQRCTSRYHSTITLNTTSHHAYAIKCQKRNRIRQRRLIMIHRWCFRSLVTKQFITYRRLTTMIAAEPGCKKNYMKRKTLLARFHSHTRIRFGLVAGCQVTPMCVALFHTFYCFGNTPNIASRWWKEVYSKELDNVTWVLTDISCVRFPTNYVLS